MSFHFGVQLSSPLPHLILLASPSAALNFTNHSQVALHLVANATCSVLSPNSLRRRFHLRQQPAKFHLSQLTGSNAPEVISKLWITAHRTHALSAIQSAVWGFALLAALLLASLCL